MKSSDWLAASAIAGAVVAVGLVELSQLPIRSFGSDALAALAFLVWLGVAVGAARWAPGVALGAAWAAGFTQLVGGVPVLLTETALVVVLFAAARWGHTVTVVFAAFSIALTPVLALGWVRAVGIQTGLGGDLLIDLLGAAGATAREWRLLLLGLTVLGIPFLSGLVLRFLSRARSAQAARQTAERGTP
jgi:hypothetical protein